MNRTAHVAIANDAATCAEWCPACRAERAARELGATDQGIARDTRPRPCSRGTWCTEPAGHEGACVEVPRAPRAPADFGPMRGRR